MANLVNSEDLLKEVDKIFLIENDTFDHRLLQKVIDLMLVISENTPDDKEILQNCDDWVKFIQ